MIEETLHRQDLPPQQEARQTEEDSEKLGFASTVGSETNIGGFRKVFTRYIYIFFFFFHAESIY